VGRRREHRIERSRQLRVGAALAAGLALLAGVLLVLASTLGNGEAAAGTPAAGRVGPRMVVAGANAEGLHSTP